MNRKILAGVAAIIVISVLGAFYLYSTGGSQTMKEGFENGLGEWVADADVPFNPEDPTRLVEWNITRSTDVASSGKYSLKLFIDGRQDDGTIWVERKIPVRKNARVNVSLSFNFYSGQESFNTIAAVCAYAGVRNPEYEDDFSVVGNANEVEGWKRYGLTADVDTGSSGEMWVALGISVRWETYMTYYVDDVEIEVR